MSNKNPEVLFMTNVSSANSSDFSPSLSMASLHSNESTEKKLQSKNFFNCMTKPKTYPSTPPRPN